MTTPNRRTPGLSSLSRTHISSSQYASHGLTLRTRQTESLQTQLSVFQSLLHEFSITHATSIRSNPQFRAEFARMCNSLGVDFLAGSWSAEAKPGEKEAGKGGIAGLGMGNWWTQNLGTTLNTFYFSLAIRIVEICRSTRYENGGLISVSDLQNHLSSPSPSTGLIGSSITATTADIIRAVDALTPLGACFSIMKIGHSQLIRSVPKELNGDQSTVLEALQVCGYVTISMLVVNLGWESARARAGVEDLLVDGLVWVDKQAGESEYWSPAFMVGVGNTVGSGIGGGGKGEGVGG